MIITHFSKKFTINFLPQFHDSLTVPLSRSFHVYFHSLFDFPGVVENTINLSPKSITSSILRVTKVMFFPSPIFLTPHFAWHSLTYLHISSTEQSSPDIRTGNYFLLDNELPLPILPVVLTLCTS